MSTAVAKLEKEEKKQAEAPAIREFSKIPTKGKEELLKVRDVFVFKKLQARTDTDSGSVVDEGRAAGFAESLKKIAADPKLPKFPPIKVMRVTDAPGHKDREVLVCWDGMHTLRGMELAKLPEVEALVWDGTWAEAQYLSATRANREHEKNGKPLSSRDKIHAVKILAAAYIDSGMPKKDWPSNRALADLCGCSRQLVNDMDPFDRGAGDVREVKAATKRADRAAGNGHAERAKAVPHFEILQKSSGQKVAEYDGASEKEALERFAEGKPEGFDAKGYIAKKVEPAKKPGSQTTPGFDWSGMDGHLSYLVRGLEGLGDIFTVKGTPEFHAATQALNSFATQFNAFRKKFASKSKA